MTLRRSNILAALVLAVVAAQAMAATPREPVASPREPGASPRELVIQRIDPPEHGFYAKVIDLDGILIKAPAEVSDEAIREAARRISRLLEHLPVVRRNLAAAGAEHHIIGRNQETSDLPEWRHMKGKPHWDGSPSFDLRVRGMGGLVSSSGEENLLKLPTDRYKDHRDICSHEFSHGILGSGVSRDVVERFEEQRKRSTAKGLWPSYAGTNTQEFFAELTMWYFGTRGDYGKITPKPQAGRAWLKSYDPESYALFDDFYSGRIPVQSNEVARVRLSPEPPVVSKALSGPCTIIVENRTDGDIKAYKQAEDGTWTEDLTVPPDAKYDTDGRAGQPWKVTDGSGALLGYFIARGKTAYATVDPTNRATHLGAAK